MRTVDDEDCRVYEFTAPPFLRSLPDSILELNALEALCFHKFPQFPPWLDKLENLESITLLGDPDLREIQNEIWDLPKLHQLGVSQKSEESSSLVL